MDPRESPDFGALLRAYRLRANLTQETLAERAGLSVRGIQAWERGTARPHRDSVARLARALGLSADQRAGFEALAPSAPRLRAGPEPDTTHQPPPPTSETAPPLAFATAADRPAASAVQSAIDGHLPAPITSFVGREQDLANVERLLETARLVTLTGPGGVGKTRLALQIATAYREHVRRDVVFVPLSSVSDPTLVVFAIARSIGLKENADADVESQLQSRLRDQSVLLILDNFEHVLAAAPTIGTLLSACSRVRALVTSRGGLNVYGEQQYPVSPLSLPPPQETANTASSPLLKGELAAVEASDAVQLFVTRARSIRPDFRLTAGNAQVVAAICQRVDGLPLAIELAAARIRLFPPTALLDRLTDRFQLLTGGPSDLPDRQRTMRNAIAWSYDLLTDREKRLFRRLAAFPGGISWEAAEAVASALDGVGDIVAEIDALVSQSLLVQQELDGAPRFRMLGLLREYGVERLTEAGEAAAIRDAHARFFARLGDEAGPGLSGPGQEVWLSRLEHEHDNLRAALHWLVEQRDADTAQKLVGALQRFWWLRGHLNEGRALCDAALSLSPTGQVSETRAGALRASGALAVYQHDFPAAQSKLEESLAICRCLGSTKGIVSALNWLGNGASFQGNYDSARALYEQALELEDAPGESGERGNLLNNLGILAYYDGNYARARELYQEGIDWHRAIGDVRGIAMGLSNLAEVAVKVGHNTEAQALFVESIRLKQRLGELPSQVIALEGLAASFASEGRCELAARVAAGAMTTRARLGLPLSAADQADLDRALAPCRQTLGEECFQAAWAEGAALTLEQTVAEVFEADGAYQEGVPSP